MNPLIDIGLWLCIVGATVAAWPFLKDLAITLQEMEDEHIRKTIERESSSE